MKTFLKTRWPWLVIGGVILLGFVVYWPQRGSSPPVSTASTTQPRVDSSTIAVDSEPTTSPSNDSVLATDVRSPEAFGSHVFYTSGTGLYSIDLTSSSAKPVQVATLPRQAAEIRWRPDGKRALALISTNPVTWLSLNLEANTTNELTKTYVGPAISSQRDRIIYTYEGPAGSNVSVADPDGSNWQAVMTPPDEIVRWWWPGDGTVAIGANERVDPPQYIRLLVGQKKIESLATSYSYDLRLKFSPDESRILINTGTLDAPTMSVAAVGGGGITSFTGTFSVRKSAWLNANTVAAIDDDWNVTLLDFDKKIQTKLGPWPDTAKPLTELVAVTDKHYYAVTNGTLVRLPRS